MVRIRRLRFTMLFLVAHLLALTPTFWLTRCEAFGYATAFAPGLAVRFWHHPLACVAALAGVYSLAYEGLWRRLAIPLGLRRNSRF